MLTFGNVEIAEITMTNNDEYTYETTEGINLNELFGSYEMPITNLNIVDLSDYVSEPTEQQVSDWYDIYVVALTTDQHAYTYELVEFEDRTEICLIGIYAVFWYIVLAIFRKVIIN